MATTSSEQRAAGHVASRTDAPQAAATHAEVLVALENFTHAFAKALAGRIVATFYLAMHILVAEAVVDMCSVPLGHALLSFVPVTANPFESASLFTTCIVAAAWAGVVFFFTCLRFFAPLIVATFRAQCYIDLLLMLFDAYCIRRTLGYAWARKFVVIRAARGELLKGFGLALFCLAGRTLEGGETAQAVLTPSQAFLSMVIGKMTIGLILHWLVIQGGLVHNVCQEGGNMDTKDSGYA